jgi:hypothetical protein
MPAWLMSAVRTAVQAGWAWLAGWAAGTLGVTLPAGAPAWLQALAAAAVVAVVTAAIRWLESRPRTSRWGRVARWVARWVMLRLPAPAYPSGRVAVPDWMVRG